MQVVNKRTHQRTDRDVYIGRPSVFGNPFLLGIDGDRTQVIARFRGWLDQATWDSQRNAALDAIRALPDDAILVCWCAPLHCHGDVIRELKEAPV